MRLGDVFDRRPRAFAEAAALITPRAPISGTCRLSSLSRLLSVESDLAEASTCEDAEPVFAGALVDLGDVAGDLAGAARHFLHVAGDFAGGGALRFDRSRDPSGDVRNLPDRAADLLDRRDGRVRRGLDAGDLLG